MSVALWILAVCAVIWTVRMIVTDVARWLDTRYRYGGAPESVKRFASLVSGVRR